MNIVLENVSKKTGDTVLLDNINLTLEASKIYGFIGSNGSGKTVLFKTILGLMKHTSGNLFVNNELRQGFLNNVGMIIERPNFIPYYSGFNNLKTVASYGSNVTDERIKSVISLVGLNPEDKKIVKHYSLGMQQKLAIALAIMEKPQVLILDEPLNAIDEAAVKNIRNILLEEKANGKLILIASHYKEDIEILCDTIYEMKNGKIIGGYNNDKK